MRTSIETIGRWLRIRQWGKRIAASAALCSALTQPGPALADCALPEPAIQWSWPAKDQSDVPVNADLLLIVDGVELASAALTLGSDGMAEQPLVPSSDVPGHYDLGSLQGHRTYSISVLTAEGVSLGFEFTTGETALQAMVAPLLIRGVQEESIRPPYERGPCVDILFRNSCYDTGIPPVQTFDVDTGALAIGEHGLWAIETTAGDTGDIYRWTSPVVCGDPRQFGYSSDGDVYRVYNVSEVGALRESGSVTGPFGVSARPQAMTEPEHIPLAQTDASGFTCTMSPSQGSGHGAFASRSGLGLGIALLVLVKRRARSRPCPL